MYKNPAELASETQRIATEQIDRAMQELDDSSLDGPVTVHQVRKRCKKMRGLLRLVRSGIGSHYKKENNRFRNAARPLSGARDASVMIDTYDSLMEAFTDEIDRPSFAPLRGKLTLRMNATQEKEDSAEETQDSVEKALADFKHRMNEACELVPKWASRITDISDLLAGMENTYRRGRDAMKTAYSKPSGKHFHEWRKHVKYHSHHCRLLRALWPPVMKARAQEAGRLADILGDAHDLEVFRELLQEDPGLCVTPERQHAILELADRRSESLHEEARLLGLRLFATKPKHLIKSLERYATAWSS